MFKLWLIPKYPDVKKNNQISIFGKIPKIYNKVPKTYNKIPKTYNKIPKIIF